MNEVDILKDMVSGSVSMNFYAIPRMTRNIDIVILLNESDVERIYQIFKDELY
jgi:hypothetical protein